MPTQVAVLTDIHSNSIALEACLARIRDIETSTGQRVEVLVGGDTLNAGPDPVGTLEFLAKVSQVHLYGNHEEYLAAFLSNPRTERFQDPLWRFVPWTAQILGASLKEYLATLRASHSWSDGACCLYHASPESCSRVPIWFPEQSRLTARVPSSFTGLVSSVNIVGHSHYSGLHFQDQGHELWVNAGSVGYAFVAKDEGSFAEPMAVFPVFSVDQTNAGLALSVVFEQVTYSGAELIESYAQSGALFDCAPYSLAILAQSLFNQDVTWPAFHAARRRGVSQKRLPVALLEFMREGGLLTQLETQLGEVLGCSAKSELSGAVAEFIH